MHRTVAGCGVLLLAWLLGGGGLTPSAVAAADEPRSTGGLFDLDVFPDGPAASPVVSVEAWWTPTAEPGMGTLTVQATIPDGAHIYSLTQEKGGPIASQITLEGDWADALAGAFQADPAADQRRDPAFNNLLVETHHDTVTWQVALRLPPSAESASLTGSLKYQLCDAGGCYPPAAVGFTAQRREPAAAAPARVPQTKHSLEPPAADTPAGPPRASPLPADFASEFVDQGSGTVFRGTVEPAVAAPGDTIHVTFSAHPGEDWHIYPYALLDHDRPASKPTLIVFALPAGWRQLGPVEPSQPPVEKPSALDPSRIEVIHNQLVEWKVALQVPADAAIGPVVLTGHLGYQVCGRSGCLRPTSLEFALPLTIAEVSKPGIAAAGLISRRNYQEVAALAAERHGGAALAARGGAADRPMAADDRGPLAGAPAAVDAAALEAFDISQVERPAEVELPLWAYVAIAFGGGFLLNFMPCVLPVIGLKILSFVQQSGEQRSRILLLNLWYTAGIVGVFLVLATIPVVMRLVWDQSFGWGQQFSYDAFNVTLVAIVFAMALSFLGVWEIPVPGLSGGSLQSGASREGLLGAFLKGVLTTILATPCSGPGLGTALSFAFTKEPIVVYTIFGSMGLGMASPYLVIGAFPSLIRFLPKPGAWMETFKQLMGFVLLGTVVFLLTYLQPANVVPTVALLMGIWLACWWIGRTPVYAETPVMLRAWLGGAVIVAAVASLAVWLTGVTEARLARSIDVAIAERLGSETLATSRAADGAAHIEWQPFSREALEQAAREGKTVMVDFTADWCATCKFLEATVLNSEEIRNLISQQGVVPLMADLTRSPELETAFLQRLSGGQQIPVLAIFPAENPRQPIVLKDLYTIAKLRQKLIEAGPSRDVAQRDSTRVPPATIATGARN